VGRSFPNLRQVVVENSSASKAAQEGPRAYKPCAEALLRAQPGANYDALAYDDV